MNKPQRTDHDYGGGSGKTVFEGSLFRVAHWNHASGQRTTINTTGNLWLIDLDLQFDGLVEFNSDEECIAQLDPKEIISLMDGMYDYGVKAGRDEKLKEIKGVLGL